MWNEKQLATEHPSCTSRRHCPETPNIPGHFQGNGTSFKVLQSMEMSETRTEPTWWSQFLGAESTFWLLHVFHYTTQWLSLLWYSKKQAAHVFWYLWEWLSLPMVGIRKLLERPYHRQGSRKEMVEQVHAHGQLFWGMRCTVNLHFTICPEIPKCCDCTTVASPPYPKVLSPFCRQECLCQPA